MKTWRTISVAGVATMVALIACFRHDLLEVAVLLTLAYVVSSIWLLIGANKKAADRAATIEKNREMVFRQWLETANMDWR